MVTCSFITGLWLYPIMTMLLLWLYFTNEEEQLSESILVNALLSGGLFIMSVVLIIAMLMPYRAGQKRLIIATKLGFKILMTIKILLNLMLVGSFAASGVLMYAYSSIDTRWIISLGLYMFVMALYFIEL